MASADELLSNVKWVRSALDARRIELEQSDSRVADLEMATEVVRMAAMESSSRLQYAEGLVRSIVQAVHGETYDFKILPGESTNGEPTLDLKIIEGDVCLGVLQHGGAVKHTVDIAFRLAITLLHPNASPVVIFDEPVTTYDDQGRMEALAQILQAFGENFGLTAIMVSHDAVDIGHTIVVDKPRHWAQILST